MSLELVDSRMFPPIPRKTVLKELPSGEIRMESGADGAWLLFDCDCLDALPYCKAQCCGLIGTVVFPEELETKELPVEFDGETLVMARDADGFCSCLNRETRTCEVYEDRPMTCQQFHCTRGASQRGWKLANSVNRQPLD
jgi:hypothetical protein